MNDLDVHRRLIDMEIPVFTISQMKAVFDMDYSGTVVKLNSLVRKGVLKRVIHGMYSLQSTDPLCIASFIEIPSYISLWSALKFHGLTTQSPRMIDIINTKRSKTIAMEHQDGTYELRFIKTGTERMFGYFKDHIGEQSCYIADPEKTIIDCLVYPEYVPFGEILNAVNEEIDPGKLIEYSTRIGKQSLMKRIGFILDKNGFDVEPEMFGVLSRTFVRLDPSGQRRGTYDKKWHILQNGVEF